MLALGDRRPVADGLIVSLTSFPVRIGSVHFVIRSLLNQSLRPQKIVLYLSSEEFPGRRLPRKVAALAGERFEIRFVEENLHPHNKLIFALSDFPKATIVTCDDDYIYPADWLARLWAAAKAKAGMIVYIRDRRISVSPNGSFAPYLDWPYDDASLEPTYWTLPLGGWGILYPPGCFHTTMGDRKLIRELSLLQDDVWNKVMSLLRDVPCCRIGVNYKEILRLHIDNNVALWTYNSQGGYDTAIERVFGHFGITPEVIGAKEAKLRVGSC